MSCELLGLCVRGCGLREDHRAHQHHVRIRSHWFDVRLVIFALHCLVLHIDRYLPQLLDRTQSSPLRDQQAPQRRRQRILQRKMHGRRRRTAAVRWCAREWDERQGGEYLHFLQVRQCEEYQGELLAIGGLWVPLELGLKLNWDEECMADTWLVLFGNWQCKGRNKMNVARSSCIHCFFASGISVN